MAVIDSKKLLPQSTKTISILVPKSSVEIASPSVSTKILQPADKPATGGGSLVVVEKLIKIDDILKDTLKVKKDREKTEDKEEEKEERQKREANLEKDKNKKKKSKNLFSIPKNPGLEWLSNWLTWTLAGFLFNNFKGLLDYLAPIWNNVIKPLGAILYGIFTGIVKGVVTFIDLGYKAYKSIEGMVEGLGGEDAKNAFNDMSGALTTVLNGAIIALMIAASTGGGPRPGGGGTKPGRGGTPRPGTGGRPKVTTSGGGRAGGTGFRNPFRARPTVSQGGAGTRVTQAVGNRVTGRGAARVTTGAGGRVAGRMGLKAAGRALKPILGRLPIVGGLIEFLISWAMGDPIGKAAFRGVGATLFAALGGIIGSVVPVFGTAIGAALGGFAGGEAGGLLYDVMFGGKNPDPKVEKKQGGGQVGGKTTNRRGRTLKKRKKKTKVSKVDKSTTQPGKDFSTEKDIEKFYGKDEGILGTGLFARQNTPYDALVKSSKIAKDNKALNGIVGSLIGTGIDLTLGQKPDSKSVRQISETLSTFVQASMQMEMNKTVESIQELFTFNEGGSIPENRAIAKRKADPAVLLRDKITRGIESAINDTSTKVFAELNRVMGIKKKQEEENKTIPSSSVSVSYSANGGAYTSAPFGSGVSVTGGSADFWTLVAIASLESGNPQGRADVAQSIYNRQKAGAANGYAGGPSIKGMITDSNQYQPISQSDRSLWAAITDKESAIAAVESHPNGKGRGKQMIEAASAAITDTALQNNAKNFVGARTDFSTPSAMSVHSAYRGTHRSSEAVRHGHVFGWFVGPGAVAYGSKVKGTGASAVPNLQAMRSQAPITASASPGGGVVSGDPKITSHYGKKRGNRRHGGVDIEANPGTPLTAVANGMFVEAGVDPGGWGQFVVYRIGGEFHLYGHLSKYAGLKKGEMVVEGGIVGYVGSTGRSTGPHLHWEMGSGWSGVIAGKKDPLSKYDFKKPFTVGTKQPVAASTPQPSSPISAPSLMGSANYDVVIPLDHTKKPGTVPDTPGGSTFTNSNATGAAGRERQHQDKAARIIAARLAAQGLRVKIMAPEEYNSYQDYDRALTKYASQGVRIVPLHFDAIRGAGGVGFLTRTRAGDAEDAAFAAPIQAVLEEFQRSNPDLGNISSDTMGNATINRAAASPAALVELGVMVDWENKYGANFTQTDKFRGFANDLADAIFKAGGFRPKTQASVASPATREVASLQRTPDYADGQTTILYQKEVVLVG